MTRPDLTKIIGGASAKQGLTLLERAAVAQARVNEATAILEGLKEEIRESHEPGKYEDDDVEVSIIETWTIDKDLAARVYPEDRFKELTYTAASLKRHLGGDAYRAIQKQGKSKVTITPKKVTG